MTATSPSPLALLTGVLNAAFPIDARIADDGALHLRMDGDLAITVAPSPDEADLVFYSILDDLARGRAVATMMAALTLNLHQEATRGGAIGADAATQTLVFSWRLPAAGLEPERLILALENFCATAVNLRASLAELVGEFSDEELQAIDQRAGAEPALSECGPLAALLPAASSSTHLIKG